MSAAARRALAALIPLGALLALGFGAPAASATTPPPDSAVPFGTTGVGANAVSNPNAPVVGVAAVPGGGGYWLVASDGGIFNYGTAGFLGSRGGQPLNKPVVGIAADTATGGYWEVASDGGIFNYGAPFLGSRGGQPLNEPIVGVGAG